MYRSNILVVVVDGLRASALGAYGNTAFPTPALDRFAADSLLLDRCYSPSADLERIYHALWLSEHPGRVAKMPAAALPSSGRSLPAVFGDDGYRATLITDESRLLTFQAADKFQNQILIEGNSTQPANERPVSTILEMELARVLAAAAETIAELHSSPNTCVNDGPPNLVWVHARGMYGHWDAPTELQRSLLDDDDLAPIESAAPPNVKLAADDDPDDVFRYTCAYAAQVIAFDELSQALWEAVATDVNAEPWVVMLIGARGFALGEHGRIGGIDPRLYVEQLHVPWLIRFPDSRARLTRSSELTTHADVLPTLLTSTRGSSNDEKQGDGLSAVLLASNAKVSWRDSLLATSDDGTRALRTAAWTLLEPAEPLDTSANEFDRDPATELYVCPDDRWEANDIASLCGEAVDELRRTSAAAAGKLLEAEPLPNDGS